MNKRDIEEKIRANRELLQEFSVKKIMLFGSSVREEALSGSDIDLLVEFKPDAEIGLFEFVQLKDELSKLLGGPVDLVTEDSLHPELRGDILREAQHVD
ncbi:MAG: nucleotidyltransferase family protein [Desulfonatronovibrionaceae bacterium]